MIRVCAHCRKEYTTFPSIKPKYCSQACASASKIKGRIANCLVCDKEFWRYPHRLRRYCSKSCARTALNLTDQNPAYHKTKNTNCLTLSKAQSISGPAARKDRSGANNPMYGRRRQDSSNWKGGRKVRKDGYILVVAPDDHPYPADFYPASGLKYILEHRLVMEQHLGRYLEPSEIVHHIDENPSNNAIENLQLMVNQSEHARLHLARKVNARTADRKYITYMWSTAWLRLRDIVLKRDNYTCQECGRRDGRLIAHRLSQETVYHEKPEDLVTLCASCKSKKTWLEV